MTLVEAAAEAGADAVKVQVINPARLINRSEVERIRQLSRFQLPHSVFADMAALAASRNMLFIASAFDVESFDAVLDLIAAVKIASGDVDFEPLLIRAAESRKPMILSTGMATLDEIEVAVRTIETHTKACLADRLALLHCVSLYPTPLMEANVRAVRTLADRFGLTVGYSDHTIGIESSVAALALGARIIEKHFTLDKTRTTFRDHALSADPADLRRLVDVAHSIVGLLGTGEKTPGEGERKMASAARRSIVAAHDLSVGTHLTMADLDFVRPRNGLPPSSVARVVGRTLRVALKAHDLIHEKDLG